MTPQDIGDLALLGSAQPSGSDFSTAGSSGFISGGATSGSGTPTTASQQYNGSTWSEVSWNDTDARDVIFAE